MVLNSPPPQFGQCRMSMLNTRLSSRAQQLRSGAGVGAGDEAGRMLPHQPVKGGLLGAMALVVDRSAVRHPLGLSAEGLHDVGSR